MLASQPTGHPKLPKAVAFGIITQALKWGPVAAGAEIIFIEIISIANECLSSFQNLVNHYEIRISHAKSTYGALFMTSVILIS